MFFFVALLAASSGFTLAFAAFAFVWTWYVGTVVILLSPRRRTPLTTATATSDNSPA